MAPVPDRWSEHMTDLHNWNPTDASNNGAIPGGFPTGALPGQTKVWAQAVMGALKREYNEQGFTLTSSGSTTVLTLTPSPAIDALADGQLFGFILGTDIAAGATLNISGKGAKALKKMTLGGITAVTGGEGKTGHRVIVAYNAADTSYCLINAGQFIGTHQIPIMAAGMIPATTNGAALGQTETSSNKVNFRTLDFDQTTQEHACFAITMPSSWDEGTVTFRAIWTAASGTGTFICGLQGLACSNDDAIDAAYGTAVTVTDTLISTGDLHVSPTSTALTIAGTPAAGDTVFFRVYRDISDTLNADAKLISVEILIAVDAMTDS